MFVNPNLFIGPSPSKKKKKKVLSALLPMWLSQGHRALLFCQTRQMLDIVEKLVKKGVFVSRCLFVFFSVKIIR
jgi:SNF2 family DNA or RNA helicase